MIRSSISEGFSNRKIGDKTMAKSKNFIKKAIGNNKGVFSAKAKAAGKSTAEYANEKASAGGKLGKEAVLARTLMGMSKKKK